MSSQIKYEFLPIDGITGVGQNDDKYRWYHCNIDNDTMNCKKVEKFNSVSEKENSQLLFVSKMNPEFMDASVLKWKMYPEDLAILTPQHLTSQFSNEPRYYQCCVVNGKEPICQRLDSTPDCLCTMFAFATGRCKILSVPGSIPRIFDTSILKYKWIPKYVNIESKRS